MLGGIVIFAILILLMQEHGIISPSVCILFDFSRQRLTVFKITGLLPPSVGLFLGILFFLMQ